MSLTLRGIKLMRKKVALIHAIHGLRRGSTRILTWSMLILSVLSSILLLPIILLCIIINLILSIILTMLHLKTAGNMYYFFKHGIGTLFGYPYIIIRKCWRLR